MSADDIVLLKQLILKHNILTEEAEGIKSCVITHHNLLHYPEDIERFSSPDNYWCFTFERAVQRHLSISCNNKNMEFTFSEVECRREFLKFYKMSYDSFLPLPHPIAEVSL